MVCVACVGGSARPDSEPDSKCSCASTDTTYYKTVLEGNGDRGCGE
jgi:hypothetical protein